MEFCKLKNEILDCQECEDLFGFTPKPVFHGAKKSIIMQISQAPSKNVHLTKKPFNDQSGRKLINEWYSIPQEIFYNENCFYITALAHCYPGKSKNGGDRLPPIKCARKWLVQEMELIENKMFVLIGSRVSKFFFPNKEFNELVFTNQQINNKVAYILPHPSPLNIKWFKDNPDFYEYRLPEIRNAIQASLYNLKNDPNSIAAK